MPKNKLKCLFVCTSAKDRSVALVNYFKEVFPNYEYKNAGVNKYFCEKNNTHYIDQEDLDWADYIVCAEDIHFKIINERFHLHHERQYIEILNCGNYLNGALGEDFLTCAEEKLKQYVLKETPSLHEN